MPKILSVVGARPQFVKLAPIASAFAADPDIEHVIVHTGQHYDPQLSQVFFDELGIPQPDVHLGVGSGTHGRQTGAMLSALDEVLEDARPDWTLVYGDTNSTLAAALAAVKMHIRIAHLEAGLRSFNRRMPEEHNRVLTDHAADLLLAPTKVAMEHLAAEGLAGRSLLVGDVMTDVCYYVRDRVRDRPLPPFVDLSKPFVVATIHRPDNTDERDRLATVLAALAAITVPVLLLAHPRLVAKASEHGLRLDQGSIQVGQPLGYPDMVRTVQAAAGVVTDSGGLQKEAYLLKTPCTTIRPETEWVETLDDGWNILDNELTRVVETAVRTVPTAAQGTPYGDGRAGERVREALGGLPA